MNLEKEKLVIILFALVVTNLVKRLLVDPIIRNFGVPAYNILHDSIFNWSFFIGLITYLLIFIIVCKFLKAYK